MMKSEISKKSILIIFIFLVTTFFFLVCLATFAVQAANVVQDYSFEWNNNTWIEAQSSGCIANQSTTAQHYQDAASGETTTTGISISSGSASLTQTMNQLITNFNASNSLSWWTLWQANATTGTRDCYTHFTSSNGKNLYYWYNLNKAPPSNNPVNYYLTITNPTYQIWNQTQRNFWQDWNQTAGFPDTENITTVKINCDANYTAATCTGTNLPCSTWNSSPTCPTQYGCSYNNTEYTVNIYPSAAGTHTDFNVQPSSLANWDAVDETPANDSDYVYSIAASKNDTYNLQDISIPASSTINNITVFERAIYYNTTSKSFYIIIRTNLLDYNGTKKSGLITLASFNTTWTTNPNTGFAWTISDINALEAGAQIAATQGGINITQVYVTVDYTPNTCYDNPGHYSCSITNYPTSSTCTGNLSCAWTPTSTFGEQFFWDVFVLNATEDTTPPVITLPAYTNATKYKNSQSLIVNISVTDVGVGPSSCVVNIPTSLIGNQTIAYSDGWCNGTYSLSGVADGNKTINAYANDTLGNTALNNSYVVWVDTTGPTITLPEYTNGTEKTNASNLLLNISVADANTPQSPCFIDVNETNQTVAYSSGWCNGTVALTGLTDGNKTIKIYDNDSLGNMALNNSYVVWVDSTAPTVTLPAYTNATKYTSSQSMIVNISVADAGVGPSYCKINIGVKPNQTIAYSDGWCNGTYSLSGVADGNKTINAYANDTLGNTALNNSYVVWIDSTAPTVTLPAYTNATKYTSSQSMIFNISVADAGVGESYCSIGVSSKANSTVAVSGGWCNGTYALATITDGNQTIYAYANDTLGNTALNNSYVVWVDSTAPVVILPAYTNATTYKNSQSLIVNISVTDAGVGPSSCVVNVATASAGNQTITYSGGWCNGTYALTGATDGNQTIKAYANDTLGNTALNNSYVVWVDSTAPIITLPAYINATTYKSTQDMIFNISVTDAGVGPSYCKINIGVKPNQTIAYSDGWCNGTYSLSGVGDGNQTINAYANDTVNNFALNNSYVVWVDSTAPIITLPAYTNGTEKTNASNLLLNISVADTNTPQSPCFIDVNGTNQTVAYSSGWCNGTVALTGLTDGNKTIKIYDNDSLGNMALNNSYVVWVDSTAPTITLPAYTNATKYTNAQNLTINISVVDLGTGSSVCRVNVASSSTGNKTIAYSGGWCNGTYALTGASNGNQTINAYANDTLGNTALNDSYVVWIDSTAPTVTLPAYTNATKYTSSQSMIFNISVADAGVGGSYCRVNIGVKPNSTVAVSDGWCNGTYSLSGVADGNKTINAYANDTLGNTALNNSYVVWVDSTAPAASFGTNPIDNYNDSDGTIIFDFKCNDTGVGVQTIQLWINTIGSWQANYSNASYVSNDWINYSVAGISSGAHKWAVYCNDSLGNPDWTDTNRTFNVDINAPDDNHPSDASYVKDSDATIGWILTDNYAPGYYYVQRNGTTQNSSTTWLNNTNLNVWINTTTGGVWNYTIFYNDSLGNSNFDEVIITIIDNPPYWSNNATSILASYSPTTQSYFNITWQDETGVSLVKFESNFSGAAENYSMNHLGSDVYNYSSILPAGTYYWKSYANDTTSQWNVSDTWIFTISKSSPNLRLYLNGSQNNRAYQIPADVNATATKNTSSEGTLEILINGTVVGSTSSSLITNITEYSSEDYINYSARFNQTENYSKQLVNYFATLQSTPADNPPEANLISPENESITTNNYVNFTCDAIDDIKLANMTFYWNYSSWQENGTENITGTENQTSFYRDNLINGKILWACLAYDNASNHDWSENRTVIINYSAPKTPGGGGGGGNPPEENVTNATSENVTNPVENQSNGNQITCGSGYKLVNGKCVKETESKSETSEVSQTIIWPWVIVIVIIVALITYIVLIRSKKRRSKKSRSARLS